MRVLLLFLGLISVPAFGQDWEWVLKAGGAGGDKANDIDIDQNGNVYAGGY